MPHSSIPALFFAQAERHDGKPIWLRKVEGEFRAMTWSEAEKLVRQCAAALLDAGLQPGDRVATFAENRPEWALVDLAVLSCGGQHVPVYATNTAAELRYILKHSGATMLFVANHEQLKKFQQHQAQLPAVRHVVVFDGCAESERDTRVASFSHWLEHGGGRLAGLQQALRQRIDALTPEVPATIIYTSGTTGEPKGVVLSHGNLLSNCEAVASIVPIYETDTHLSVLPLSHVFERMAGHYLMMQQGAVVAYAESMDAIAQNMLEVRPTIMCAVPRLYEKMHAKILDAQRHGSFVKRSLARWAVGAVQRLTALRLQGAFDVRRLTAGQRLACALIGNKLKRQLGGRFRFFVSGGAPLAVEIAAFFDVLGVIILEGYGLTETSPVIAVNTLDAKKLGTVGKPVPGVDVRIAEDGEIETRGPHIMKGYFNDPAATADTLRNGWLCTGDIGELDGDGFLRITDRKKELIITAGGKNIPPQKIENALKTDPLINQVFVYGDRKPYLVALIVPHMSVLQQEAAAQGIRCATAEELVKHPETRRLVERRVRLACQDLAPYEQIKYCALLSQEFTREAEEMTPTLKLRRKIISERYREMIESLYV